MTEILDPLRLADWSPALGRLEAGLRRLFQRQVEGARHLDQQRPPLLALTLTNTTIDGCSHTTMRRLVASSAGWAIFRGTIDDLMRGLPTTFEGEFEVRLALHDEASMRPEVLLVPAQIWPPDRPQPSTVPLRHQLSQCEREKRFLWRVVREQDRDKRHMFIGASSVIHACSDAMAAMGTSRRPQEPRPTGPSTLESLAAGVTGAILDRFGVERPPEGQPHPRAAPSRSGGAQTQRSCAAEEWSRSVVWVLRVLVTNREPVLIFVERSHGECAIWQVIGDEHRHLARRSVELNRPWRRDSDLVEWVLGSLEEHGILPRAAEASPDGGLEEPLESDVDEPAPEQGVCTWINQMVCWRQPRMATDGETLVWVTLVWDRGVYQLTVSRGPGRPPACFRRAGPETSPRDPGVRVMSWIEEQLELAAVAPPVEANAKPIEPDGDEGIDLPRAEDS